MHKIITLLLLSLVISGCSGEKSIVEQRFEDYKLAIVYGEAEKAWELSAPEMRDYYAQLATHVQASDEQRISQLPMTSLLILVRARAQMEKEVLLALTGKTLFVEAFNRGWANEDKIATTELKITKNIENQVMEGQFITDGEAFDAKLFAQKIDDEWHFNFTEAIYAQSERMEKEMKKRDMTPVRYVMWLHHKQTGDPLDPLIVLSPIDFEMPEAEGLEDSAMEDSQANETSEVKNTAEEA